LCIAAAVQAEEAASERSELSALLEADAGEVFEKATVARPFEFPEDHGPHPRFRNEWWYVTGNVEGDDRRFGYELTIFRFALSPEAPSADSSWRSNQVYIAHFALTDANGEAFYAAERYSRGAAGLAGAETDPFRVWIDDWQLSAEGSDGPWRLAARDEAFAIDVELEALKAPVQQGVNGLSQKSAEPGNASYYYSITRLATRGSVWLGERRYAVEGESWLDREWSSSALGAEQQGWDWFALQLSDGTELMYYKLRRNDGSRDSYSAGSLVDDNSAALHLDASAVDITVLDTWSSPSGGTYPSSWRLSVPAEDLILTIQPVMANQELTTLVRYWEGAVDVVGERAGTAISGRGYVELTGYADADPE
jgi:predicted secreted hydrolase